MTIAIPAQDGELNVFNLTDSYTTHPRIYYVNGIRVSGKEHALTAALLSVLTERPIHGIYNKTSGAIVDLGQCGLDYLQNAMARPTSPLNRNRHVPDREVEQRLRQMIDRSVVWNRATLSLVKQLVRNRVQQQLIIAHSQGNLITSNALFVVENLLGARGLQKIRVYSLASPAPAWPVGLRRTHGGGGRQENAFMNDLVALLRPHNLAAKLGIPHFQNAGDFRTDPNSGAVSIRPHDTNLNIQLNFLKSIRGDIGLSKNLPESFFTKSQDLVERELISNPDWKQFFESKR